MRRTVTLPADGAKECGFADQNQIAPQASRQCSRRGRSTAVAGLACHVICSWRLVPRTPRHMPRQSSRSLGCAVAARRLLPLPCKHVSRSRRPFQSLEAPCRAGWSARLRWGGAGLSVVGHRDNRGFFVTGLFRFLSGTSRAFRGISGARRGRQVAIRHRGGGVSPCMCAKVL